MAPARLDPMIRALISGLIKLLANTVGLIVAGVVLSGVSLSGVSFIVAVVLFTAIEVVAEPLLRQISERSAPALAGGVALISTFIGLVLTTVLTNGLRISGAGTWLLATLIVWVAALVAGLILPLFVLKRTAQRHARR